jgi:hypothetical protein
LKRHYIEKDTEMSKRYRGGYPSDEAYYKHSLSSEEAVSSALTGAEGPSDGIRRVMSTRDGGGQDGTDKQVILSQVAMDCCGKGALAGKDRTSINDPKFGRGSIDVKDSMTNLKHSIRPGNAGSNGGFGEAAWAIDKSEPFRALSDHFGLSSGLFREDRDDND